MTASATAPPFLSFCVPAFRRPPLLRAALASIAAQAPAEPWEVIVSDDGGLPETAAVVAEFPPDRFTLCRNPRPGAVGNWNHALARARGRWVTLLHEDDCLFPWWFRLVRPHLVDGVAAVATRVVQGAGPPPLREPAARPRVPRVYRPLYFLKSAFTPFPGVALSREQARQLGGFDERWGALADYAFWYRLAQSGPVLVVRAPGAFYRVGEGQWTSTEWPVMLRRMHLLRLQIAREQLPQAPRLGRWLARFFTLRTARSYAARFAERPAGLARALRFQRIPGRRLPSGWVWQVLQRLG